MLFEFRCATKWICNHDEKCVRLNKDPRNLHTYNSQRACRLVCGLYGATWPQPTKSILLGKTLFSFNPNDLKYTIFKPQNTNTKSRSYPILDRIIIFVSF